MSGTSETNSKRSSSAMRGSSASASPRAKQTQSDSDSDVDNSPPKPIRTGASSPAKNTVGRFGAQVQGATTAAAAGTSSKPSSGTNSPMKVSDTVFAPTKSSSSSASAAAAAASAPVVASRGKPASKGDDLFDELMEISRHAAGPRGKPLIMYLLMMQSAVKSIAGPEIKIPRLEKTTNSIIEAIAHGRAYDGLDFNSTIQKSGISESLLSELINFANPDSPKFSSKQGRDFFYPFKSDGGDYTRGSKGSYTWEEVAKFYIKKLRSVDVNATLTLDKDVASNMSSMLNAEAVNSNNFKYEMMRQEVEKILSTGKNLVVSRGFSDLLWSMLIACRSKTVITQVLDADGNPVFDEDEKPVTYPKSTFVTSPVLGKFSGQLVSKVKADFNGLFKKLDKPKVMDTKLIEFVLLGKIYADNKTRENTDSKASSGKKTASSKATKKA